MAISIGATNIYDRLNQYDSFLYDKLLGEKGMITKAQGFMQGTSTLTGAIGRGFSFGLPHLATGFKEATGLGYLSAGLKHYAKFTPGSTAMARMPRYVSEWDKYFINVHKGLDPNTAAARGARVKKLTAGRTTSALKVLGRGIAPGFAIYMATESEHGFGIGIAEQVAGFTMWGMGGSMGMQLGGWAGGSGMIAAGSAISKVPGVKRLAATALGRSVGKGAIAAGAMAGGPLGWLIGGLLAFETAAWGVGMALHTLPTFAKQFKSDMSTSGYGGDYTESAGAITMRQRSLQVMGKSFVNARSALGQEGALLHA